MMDKIKNKLKSRAGESIAEVLVALLISSLALMMLAGLVSASARIVERSEGVVENYVSASNALVQHSGDGDGGTVTFKADGVPVNLTNDDADAAKTIPVKYFKNTVLGNNTVTSYTKDTTGTGA